MGALKEFVDQIIADGIITNDEHEEFMRLVHQDGEIDAAESAQISRIFALIREGKVQIVDNSKKAIDDEKLNVAKASAIDRDLAHAERDRIAAQRRAEQEEDENRIARRKQIEAVLTQSEQERAAAHNTIAEFLEKGHAKKGADAAEEGTAKRSVTNSLLQRAKERLEGEYK